MHFLGVESQKDKEMAELKENGSNPERIQEGKGKEHAAETNYNNTITSSELKINTIKNSVSSNALGLFSTSSSEKGSFSTELRLGMAFEERCDEKMSLPSWIRSVNGGAKRAVGEFMPRLDLSSVGSSSNSINLLPSQSGFGSPIEVTGKFQHRTLSDKQQDGCSGFVASSRPAESMLPGKQSCPQLTIFYAGKVIVYDDIPADKAQAIMLIASSGNYSSDPHTKVQNGCGLQTEQKISVPAMKLTEGAGIHPKPAIRKVNTDLPIARKHSLQRFLEKRKDRMNANAMSTYTTAAKLADNIKLERQPSSSAIWLHSNFPA